MRLSRLVRVAAVLLAFAGVGACEFDERTIAPGREQPVIHAVLDPFTGTEYEVLVERTLTGRVTVSGRDFDPDDPIVTGEGVPISGARVELYEVANPDPVSPSIGIEDATVRPDGKGRGVYRFQNVPRPIFGGGAGNERVLVRGRRYHLRVTTPEGRVVTGATTIPLMQIVPDTMEARTFDREHDTYAFTWPAAEQAYRYQVTVYTPYGSLALFTARASMDLSGDLRYVITKGLPLALVPGFLTPVQVHAVDTNFYDYYRSVNDPFTGSGLIEHLDGGTGLFGSVVAIRTSFLEVVAPIDEPGEGEWVLEDPAFPPVRLTLYFTGELVSGRWLQGAFPTILRSGVIGARSGTTLSLRLLAGQSDRATRARFTAALRGATLVLRGEDGVELTFVRP